MEKDKGVLGNRYQVLGIALKGKAKGKKTLATTRTANYKG